LSDAREAPQHPGAFIAQCRDWLLFS